MKNDPDIYSWPKLFKQTSKECLLQIHVPHQLVDLAADRSHQVGLQSLRYKAGMPERVVFLPAQIKSK